MYSRKANVALMNISLEEIISMTLCNIQIKSSSRFLSLSMYVA